jgi:CBS-domain-containing membrane protein
VLIYGAQQSPLAQPKNVLGGHGIAALVGVTCYKAMGSEWYAHLPAWRDRIQRMLI